MSDPSTYPGMPRWMKLQGIFVAILLLLIIALSTGLIGMGHGAMGGERGGHIPPKGGH